MLRYLGLAILGAVACSAIPGCALPFYMQAVGGQLELLRKRTPIETLLENPNIDASLREELKHVAEIRRFAVEELHLPDNGSYKSYVDLERQYVVWNVVASEEFSVAPNRWCFPFAGCVAYRGFFERDKAERFRARLERRGLDTHLGGSSAYSTLGYFADPVLSTMIGGGQSYVAGILLHELAHQKLYIKDDSELSEAFASVVEEYGTELWLRRREDEEALQRYKRRIGYRADFAQLVARQQARLQEVFARQESDDRKRRAKAEAFETMREEYAALKDEWGGARDYDTWFSQPLNNAMLASVATYRRWLPALRWRLEVLGIEDFYADIGRLAGLPARERALWLEAWLAQESTPRGLSQTG
jgi:predicted aminopeptidase